jgi:hypothetical protein
MNEIELNLGRLVLVSPVSLTTQRPLYKVR